KEGNSLLTAFPSAFFTLFVGENRHLAEKDCPSSKNLHILSRVTDIIHVQQLTKSYNDVRAVQGIDFTVKAGAIFAMLGPNGAGKSTTVEILEGLRPRDGGDVSVLGIDPARDANKLKSRIGVVLQQTIFPNKIRVIEVIELYARLYNATPNPAKLLERFA